MAKNYGSFGRDDNKQPILAGTSFLTEDATGTPQTSPLTVSSSILTIAVPTNAAEVVLYPSGADLRVSEESDASPYYKIADGSVETFGVSRMDNFYVVRDASTDVTLNFRFVLV